MVIGSSAGPSSSLWRVWSWDNEVYVATANHGGVEKFSFHSSRICRKAFTRERGTPDGLTDRATMKWTRGETPDAGSGQGTCVFELAVPTDFLSAPIEHSKKPVVWIEPAPAGMATVLEMFYTRESEDAVRVLIGGGRVVVSSALPNGEVFFVARRDATFTGEEFYIPASHHQNEDYIFVRDDPLKTGRPVRFTAYMHRKDDKQLTAWEYGGYRGVLTPELAARGLGTFTQQQVLDRSPTD